MVRPYIRMYIVKAPLNTLYVCVKLAVPAPGVGGGAVNSLQRDN